VAIEFLSERNRGLNEMRLLRQTWEKPGARATHILHTSSSIGMGFSIFGRCLIGILIGVSLYL
jgi:hypothetical protein